ncbi:hypothetical protein GXP67_10700 [Rhodocytophaga rosea]|uniref:GyrI-like domain-containing protein n=1 Tax=Rhodocytophaga rosea TaxID=2704465 RepID=A0A6C0GH66_9BACT|nr:hypothetical protein [Rhodocytophaga rosea]QHT67083.1 hypothetical protein GXP67_10700 [Rhodocytophaga rosea]
MKIAAIIVTIIAGMALIGYTFLGGFQKIPFSHTTIEGYILAGIPYKGKATDQKFRELFEKVNIDHKAGKIKGTLAAIYYDTPGADKGKVDAVIGTLVPDSLASLPASYKYMYLAGTQAVRAEITSHPAVAPAPDKLKQKLMEYAWENKLKPQNIVIEKYINERNLQIEIPVKTN